MLNLRLVLLFLLFNLVFTECKKSTKIQLPDGGNYKGMIVNEKPHGKGKVVYSDLRYEGDFINGKRHGNGVQTWIRGIHEGESYIGEWKEDERDGYGIHVWPDGRKYTGYWKNNRQNGKGMLTNAIGETYNGFFKDDLPEGEGIHTSANGKVIHKGLWSKGKPVK